MCRRKKALEGIYDRRRSILPHRTPPPLRQGHTCWCWAFWRFEWWNFRVCDEEYLQAAKKEYQERQEASHKKESSRTKELEQNKFQSFLKQAERD